MINIKKIKVETKKYLDKFDITNKDIFLKYEHTFEIVRIMDMMTSKMKFNEEDKSLALTIAYLHDIGRFEQIVKTNSMLDCISDHADNGVDLLFNRDLIKEFSIPKKYYRIIEVSIRNHNKLFIEDGLNERELFFCKLIRDIDKIDVFRVRNKFCNDTFLDKPTDICIEDFYNHKSIKLTDRKTKSDFVICTLAFVYDFYFKESIELLKELGTLNLYIDGIEVDESLKDIFNKLVEEVNKYLEEYDEK